MYLLAAVKRFHFPSYNNVFDCLYEVTNSRGKTYELSAEKNKFKLLSNTYLHFLKSPEIVNKHSSNK